MEINYDELIKQGLKEYFEREFSALPPDDEIDVTFSAEYLKRKEEIIEENFCNL